MKKQLETAWFQEYAHGVGMFYHYFYSPLKDEVELLGMDRRYESTIDNLGRIPAKDQLTTNFVKTYTVVGNFPVVARESSIYLYIVILSTWSTSLAGTGTV